MATLYGGAMPDDFVSGEELTATEFNKVKNYWIVDGDLPEGPEINDGDVVFVLGDETVGTADITAITGSGVTHTYDGCIAFEFLTSGTMTSTGGIIEEALVIGGGASGMMAAGRAASLGKKVLLFEKNKNLGEKLKISGGGRCNILNAEESENLLLANYGDAKQFLISTFLQFK